MHARNPAARAGRWSAQHRKTAILGWILFVVLAAVARRQGRPERPRRLGAGQRRGQARRHDRRGRRIPPPGRRAGARAGQGRDAGAPEVTAAVRDVVARLGRIDGVSDDRSRPRRAVSKDGRSVVVNFELRRRRRAGQDAASRSRWPPSPPSRPPTRACGSSSSATPRRRRRSRRRTPRTARSRRLISYALLLIILLVAFGALVAAGLPLVLGATAVAGTVGLLGPVSHLYALPVDVAELVVIIGLAVGVDYAMFYSRRVMEERDRGHSAEAAIEIAAATSGRTVLISGLTVMTAMAGLLFAGNPIFVGFGIGTMLVVAVAVLGSMTFLPAMLSFLSRKNWLEKGRVPIRDQAPPPGQGRVTGVGRDHHPRPASARSCRRCWPARCWSGCASRRSGIQFKEPGYDGYSRSQPVIQTYDRLQAAFPGGAIPATTVIKAKDVTAAPVRAAIAQLHDQAIATGALSEPSNLEISPDKTVAVLALSVKGSGTDAASERSVRGAARARSSRPPSAGSPARTSPSAASPPAPRTSSTSSPRGRRSCSCSCSASRSSCCWSRSARSSCRSRRSSSTCSRSAPPTASSSSSSRTATASGCWTSSPSAASRPGSRCSCS